MLNLPHQLVRAGVVDTVGGYFIGRAHENLAAGRAHARHLPGLFAALAQFLQRAQYLGNDISGPLDQDDVADANVQLLNIVCVVERGGLNCHPSYRHRSQGRIRRDRAGTPYFHANVQQSGCRLFAAGLEGHRPARVLASEAQLLLLGKQVHLYDHPVQLVG